MRRRALLGLLSVLPIVRPVAAGEVELVMFELDSCPYCRQWHAEIGPVYPKTPEGRRAPLRRVDLRVPRPADLRSIRDIRYTPTFVLLQGGAEVGRITGYPGEDFFWPMLDDLLSRLEERPAAIDHIRT